MPTLTLNQVLLLNPWAGLSEVEGLVRRTVWHQLGVSSDKTIAWGICRQKHSKAVVIDLKHIHRSECSGRRSMPHCQHVLSLMCMWIQSPELFRESDPQRHDFIRKWRKRMEEQERNETRKNERLRLLRDPIERRKINQMRLTDIGRTSESLGLWLVNMLKHGLADEQVKNMEMWKRQITRAVDADAMPVAAKLSQMKKLVESATGDGQEADWQEALLVEMSNLYLLLHSLKQFETLPGGRQGDLRTAIGWHYNRHEVMNGTTVEDDWYVLGEHDETIVEPALRQRRTWLQGIQSGKEALLVQHAVHTEPFDYSLKTGDVGHGTLTYRPSNYPLEAFIQTWQELGPDVQWRATGHSIQKNLDAYQKALTADPWLTHFPFLLEGVEIQFNGTKSFVRDPHGGVLPIQLNLPTGGRINILGLTGSRPIRLAAEWDGQMLVRLGLTVDGNAVDLPRPAPSTRIRQKKRKTTSPPKQWMSAALVGTASTYDDVVASSPALMTLASQLPNASVEQLLFFALANQSLQDALTNPLRHPSLQSLPNPPKLPQAPADQGHRLQCTDEMLGYFRTCYNFSKGNTPKPLLELIKFVHANQIEVPHTFLSEVVGFGADHPEWRDEIWTVLGTRGRWLATAITKNHSIAEWDWVKTFTPSTSPAPPHGKRFIEEGADMSRKDALFHHWRQAHPDQAGTWLECQNLDTVRIAWLESMASGLTMKDEPFLEEILKHQKAKHKEIAMRLLAQLPDSRFCQRMIDRLEKHVDAKATRERFRETLVINVVIQRIANSMETQARQSSSNQVLGQDGVVHPKSRLEELLSFIPPRYWYKEWKLTPKQLVDTFASVKKTGACDPVFGLYRAAANTKDEALLLEIVSTRHYQRFSSNRLVPQMTKALPSKLLCNIAQRCFEKAKTYPHVDTVKCYLDNLDRTKGFIWTEGLMEAFVGSIERYTRSSQRLQNVDKEICQDVKRFTHSFPLSMRVRPAGSSYIETLEKKIRELEAIHAPQEPYAAGLPGLITARKRGVRSNEFTAEVTHSRRLLKALNVGFNKAENQLKQLWSDTMDEVGFWMDFRSEMYYSYLEVNNNHKSVQ